MESDEAHHAAAVKSENESAESQMSGTSGDEQGMTSTVTNPHRDEEDLDTEYVNIGYYNWLALRQNWKTPAPGWKPTPKKHVDASKIYEEMQGHGSVSQRVPLSDFVQVVFEIWETEGFN